MLHSYMKNILGWGIFCAFLEGCPARGAIWGRASRNKHGVAEALGQELGANVVGSGDLLRVRHGRLAGFKGGPSVEAGRGFNFFKRGL